MLISSLSAVAISSLRLFREEDDFDLSYCFWISLDAAFLTDVFFKALLPSVALCPSFFASPDSSRVLDETDSVGATLLLWTVPFCLAFLTVPPRDLEALEVEVRLVSLVLLGVNDLLAAAFLTIWAFDNGLPRAFVKRPLLPTLLASLTASTVERALLATFLASFSLFTAARCRVFTCLGFFDALTVLSPARIRFRRFPVPRLFELVVGAGCTCTTT